MRAQQSSSGIGLVRRGGAFAAWLFASAIGLGPIAAQTSAAQDIAYFRIGAGAPGSTLYELAGQIASAISNPPGSRQCDSDGPCGVEGLIGLAQTTMDPVEGLKAVEGGLMESAIVSADIAADALEGSGPFKKTGAMSDLRAIANVGQLVLHVLVAKEARYKDLAELKGKRVAVGVKDSDNAVTARFLLRAAGIGEKKTKLLTGDPATAAQELLNDEVDALALVALLPNEDVAALMRSGNYRLLAARIADDGKSGHVVADWIPHMQYASTAATPTLSVPAVWIVRDTLSEELASGLAKALWRSAIKPEGSAASGTIDVNVDHLSVPLHPGAEAAFRELLKIEGPLAPEPKPTTTN